MIRLYEDRGTSEQFYTEIKSDMDMERLPSGKFATNALILTLGGLAYNILRAIGQLGLVSGQTPMRHAAKWRRVKAVMQELIYLAAQLVRIGRRLKLVSVGTALLLQHSGPSTGTLPGVDELLNAGHVGATKSKE